MPAETQPELTPHRSGFDNQPIVGVDIPQAVFVAEKAERVVEADTDILEAGNEFGHRHFLHSRMGGRPR